MIVVTGAAGFIGSCVAKFLSRKTKDLVLVDDFTKKDKWANLAELKGYVQVPRTEFFEWAERKDIETIVHLGARTDTTEFDYNIFQKLNVDYTHAVWELCAKKNIKLIYASSAATYGGGEFGYNDDHEIVEQLSPLNPYGVSKNEFDKWSILQSNLSQWYGLKFFNVYGPNESHKGRMASVIFHAFNQITERGNLRLFRSHNPNFADGGQLRDFVYVKDICRVVGFLLDKSPESGLYNLGTGKARTFLDLGKAVFQALNKEESIEFIDTPLDIRNKYQYFTEANMDKLRKAGYTEEFTSLESGVEDYVLNHLSVGASY